MARQKRKKPATTKRNKTGLLRRLYIAIFAAISMLLIVVWRLLCFLVRSAWRNPYAALGVILFVTTLSFVGFNALYRQPAIDRDVFFTTRQDIGDENSRSQQVAIIPQPNPLLNDDENLSIEALVSGNADQIEQSVSSASGETPIHRLQHSLQMRGLYNGPIDGRNSPALVQALNQWYQIVSSGMSAQGQMTQTMPAAGSLPVEQSASLQTEDGLDREIVTGSLSPVPAVPSVAEMNNESNQTLDTNSQTSAPLSEADNAPFIVNAQMIVRVQAALRAFGNDTIIVTGVMDNDTREAIQSFRQMFALPDGKEIDQTLVQKLQEVGLLG